MRRFSGTLAIAALLTLPFATWAAPQHAITLYGKPKYKPGFTHFDYAEPDAPKGGAVKLASPASFDNLNPFILKGVKAPGIGMTFETLMTGSLDEPQSMYGLLAESVDIAADNRSAVFFLNPNARWHDGTPVTAEDAVFSFNTLIEKGDPTYKIVYADIEKIQKTGPLSVKFTFKDPKNRELPTIAASLSVFSKAYYEKNPFDQTTLTAPMGSGPYKVKSVDQGRSIVYERVKDYWGAKLPVNVGQNNFDEIRYDVYRDETVMLEAFKSGGYDYREEYVARNWATAYDFPAIKDGRVVKRTIENDVPTGMQCFIFNVHNSKFKDRRVREAITLAMDFEWMNKTLFYGAYKRNSSFFMNTEFAANGLPGQDELALLEPYRAELPPELFTQAFAVPLTDGSGNNRKNLLRAQALLNEAGWVIKDGFRVNRETGEPLTVEFMLNQPTFERVVAPIRKNLERLGIPATIRMVDDSQYQKRVDTHDYDVISTWFNRQVFFPGNEQKALWHSSQADVEGSNNIGGVKNAVVDAMIDRLLAAKDLPHLTAAARALDRVLLWENYVIPHWHAPYFRVVHWDKFAEPKTAPRYAVGFSRWWIDKDKEKALNAKMGR